MSVKLTNAALDTTPQGDIVLRGVLSPESLGELLVADYQREAAPVSSLSALMKAFDEGKIPDVELGMRGGNFKEVDGIYLLEDPVAIIDGLQRVTAAKAKIVRGDEILPRVGAMVHFNTVEAWERDRFRILNLLRTKVSPNVLLRNWREEYLVMEVLYALSHSQTFVLNGRVSWGQRASRNELISAMTLCKVVGRLHAHLGASTTSTRVDLLTPALQRVTDSIGRNVFRDNVKTFFDIVDKAWGVQRVQYKENAVWLRYTFLASLSIMLSSYEDFWKDNKRLFLDAPMLRKLSSFPVSDPTVGHLAGASGKAGDMLMQMMANHMNSGRRTRHLTNRYGELQMVPTGTDADDSEPEEEAS